jgi:hypothetical protein
MSYDVDSFDESTISAPRTEDVGPARRMFLFEPGWRIGVKTGSEREFCHMMVPGQDFYHRLRDREVFLFRNGEKLCLLCAARRGLIAFEPKQLREVMLPISADLEAIPLELDVSRIMLAEKSPHADRQYEAGYRGIGRPPVDEHPR